MFEKHIEHLWLVLERLLKVNLKLNLKKYSFLCKFVWYLGFIVFREGFAPDHCKTGKVQGYPVPTKLRQILGLALYYRCFIAGFAKVVKPLHALTKKGVHYYWTEECQQSFDQLKKLLCRALVY